MAHYIIGIADFVVTAEPEALLVTYSLGSCIGVAIFDPYAKVGGMLHYMLPDSSIDPQKAVLKPAMFADTGIPLLFKSAYKLGLDKKRTRVVVAGGSQILDEAGTFNIGKRNYAVLRKIFWKNNVLIDSEDVGGNASRSLYLDTSTGKVWTRNGRKEETVL